MARRIVGGLAAAGLLLGLVTVVPVVADAASGATQVDGAVDAVAAPSLTTETPFDPGPLILLLVSGGIGAMGMLSRPVEPVRDRARR